MGVKQRYGTNSTGTHFLQDAHGDPMVGEDGAPYWIKFYGPGSKQYAQADSDRNNLLMDKARRRGGKVEMTPQQKAAMRADFLTKVTAEASPNFLKDFESDYPGSVGHALFTAVYSDREIAFIAEQSERYVDEWGNFSKPATETSPST